MASLSFWATFLLCRLALGRFLAFLSRSVLGHSVAACAVCVCTLLHKDQPMSYLSVELFWAIFFFAPSANNKIDS